ncbi:MAG: hypothetical protein H6569_15675 [Lewinellaceae bacterium]|nr:hypothetical protein [Lewinellaceae bacterium]
MQENSEFYIGWQAEVPPGIARTVRRYVLALAVLMPLFIVLLTVFQRGFSNAVFEYGKQTTLEGVYTVAPVPFLTLQNGTDAAGRPVFQKILLVGPGKFGFQTEVPNPLEEHATDGETVKASGFLIYHDGKTAMEVSGFQTIAPALPQATGRRPNATLGKVRLRGEVTDPKCLLGVMKPGQGKPHRDCAVRCLAGGIPPVLKVANATGASEYYLLAGPDGESINARILEYAGDGVELCGTLEQSDDWLILYVDLNSLKRINKWVLNPGPMCQ